MFARIRPDLVESAGGKRCADSGGASFVRRHQSQEPEGITGQETCVTLRMSGAERYVESHHRCSARGRMTSGFVRHRGNAGGSTPASTRAL